MPVLIYRFINTFVTGVFLLLATSCQTDVSDVELEKQIRSALNQHPDIQIIVEDRQVTLSGTATSEEERRQIERTTKAVDPKAVQNIVNNIAATATPDEIDPADADLQARANEFTKSFPNIEVVVAEGIITVTGELNQQQAQKLKAGLDTLNSEGVDLRGLTIN